MCVFRGGWGVVYCCNAAVVCVFRGGWRNAAVVCVFLGGDGSLCIAVMLHCVCVFLGGVGGCVLL